MLLPRQENHGVFYGSINVISPTSEVGKKTPLLFSQQITGYFWFGSGAVRNNPRLSFWRRCHFCSFHGFVCFFNPGFRLGSWISFLPFFCFVLFHYFVSVHCLVSWHLYSYSSISPFLCSYDFFHHSVPWMCSIISFRFIIYLVSDGRDSKVHIVFLTVALFLFLFVLLYLLFYFSCYI